jgi:hypothetical protein
MFFSALAPADPSLVNCLLKRRHTQLGSSAKLGHSFLAWFLDQQGPRHLADSFRVTWRNVTAGSWLWSVNWEHEYSTASVSQIRSGTIERITVENGRISDIVRTTLHRSDPAIHCSTTSSSKVLLVYFCF